MRLTKNEKFIKVSAFNINSSRALNIAKVLYKKFNYSQRIIDKIHLTLIVFYFKNPLNIF